MYKAAGQFSHVENKPYQSADNVAVSSTRPQQEWQLVGSPYEEDSIVNAPAPCAASQREPASETSSAVGYDSSYIAANSVPSHFVNVANTVTDEKEDVFTDKFASCQSEVKLTVTPSSAEQIGSTVLSVKEDKIKGAKILSTTAFSSNSTRAYQ